MYTIFYFAISVFILLISYFVPFLFIKVFILFNLVLQLQFLICLVFHFGPHFFLISNFILGTFVEVFFFFQFNPSINLFVVLFFSI